MYEEEKNREEVGMQRNEIRPQESVDVLTVLKEHNPEEVNKINGYSIKNNQNVLANGNLQIFKSQVEKLTIENRELREIASNNRDSEKIVSIMDQIQKLERENRYE